jgi:cytochrome c oxidase assembly protein subunit 15
MNKNTSIKIWLYTLVFMVFSMVFIGGITRLTDSGLSMVDWKPIMGAIPPLTDIEWEDTFQKYQHFPEYKLVNHRMNLTEFKQIFFWEYFHRLVGRLLGVLFLFPFIFFVIQKKIGRRFGVKLLLGFALGGAQGLMGWYMVKSGLVNNPDVSHFRLAAHLLLAFLIMSYLYWLILELNYPKRKLDFNLDRNKTHQSFIAFFAFIIIMQFLYGAFVAGLDAGLTHNTFPKMGNSWIPNTVFQTDLFGIVNNPVIVQLVHRLLGFALLVLSFLLLRKRKTSKDFQQNISMLLLSVGLWIQFILGVITLLLLVPVGIASLHQVGGCLILLILVRCIFFTYTTARQQD